MRKSILQNVALAVISTGAPLIALELAIRIFHGELFRFDSFTSAANRVSRMEYDARLGWTPLPGKFSDNWTWNVDGRGIRENGRNFAANGRAILAVGDSFTFGDEVGDSETWPAYLEGFLNRRVLNAGVGAYGIDQAVLRAERLMAEHDPEVVILAFISDDVNRTEFSFYPYGRGWKPYFELDKGVLKLRNVPVPKTPPQFYGFQSLRAVLGYSYLANAIFRRNLPLWWNDVPQIVPVHENGEAVSTALLVQLSDLARSRGSQLLVVTLHTVGRIGGDGRLPNVVRDARAAGIRVLDLATEARSLPDDQLQRAFRPRGHYSPEMNAWVASRISADLR